MIFPPNRKPVDQKSSPEEWRDTMRGAIADYGTYRIDDPTGRVIHHVQAASNPAWVGDDFIRWYRFDSQKLLLSLDGKFDDPLVWERLPRGPGPAATPLPSQSY